MCLICVEYYLKRMTKDEMKNALPEMVQFAKTEEERGHFKKLQSLGSNDSDEELNEEIKQHALKAIQKDSDRSEFKASFKSTKSRRY